MNKIEDMNIVPNTEPENGDYTGGDGLLHCGKCHKPKEAYFPEGKALFGLDRHPAECDCQRAQRMEREAAEQRRRHLDTVEDLKRSVIDSRYRSRRPLIVTTNLTLQEIQTPTDTAHARIYDRLLEMCAPVRFTGGNFRKGMAQSKLEELKKLINE